MKLIMKNENKTSSGKSLNLLLGLVEVPLKMWSQTMIKLELI